MNKLFSISLCLIFALIGCQNASDKINSDKSQATSTPQPSNTNKNNNAVNAQIIDEGGKAQFSWTNKGGQVWDFGTITQGDSPEFTFTFINNGTEPMIISNAKGSCGCTVPSWPKEPIPPKGTGEINVKFNSKNKKGNQNKTVTLTANTTPPNTKLRVTGNIEVIE
ncbi:MAG: DUF1573 domain-containing protein [Flavobacteriales bacterium TMED191]|nr:MAG: DUF1573 domain-containing protein [Flavobacteriales bacterium TMED191]